MCGHILQGYEEEGWAGWQNGRLIFFDRKPEDFGEEDEEEKEEDEEEDEEDEEEEDEEE